MSQKTPTPSAAVMSAPAEDSPVQERAALPESEKPAAAAPSPMDPSQFPDGGMKAWLTVIGSFCCLFVSFGWINSIGVFQQYYQTHQLSNLSASTIAWIPGLEVFILMFMGEYR